jgi:hypothetical protein
MVAQVAGVVLMSLAQWVEMVVLVAGLLVAGVVGLPATMVLLVGLGVLVLLVSH